MKKIISEQEIRRIIKKYLLLEAKYQLKNLLEFKNVIIEEDNLFDKINNQFIKIGGNQHDLNNPKSAGRFFIDALFDCMNEIKEIIKKDGLYAIDIPDRILTICNYIIFIFTQKEITSKTVQSGQTFKDYILNFINNYNKESTHSSFTSYERLESVFNNLNEKSAVSSLDIILKNKEYIKSDRETLYPFGKDVIIEGYKVVAPLTTRSSIFWARTNYLGEDIVLPKQEDISWCTARFKGGNMFNSYFIGGGTNLFYFLPENDISGTEKFCIGITKLKNLNEDSEKYEDLMNFKDELNEEDYKIKEYEYCLKYPDLLTFSLNIGGETAVNFNNNKILEEKENDFLDLDVQEEIKNAVNISSDKILDKLALVMKNKKPADIEKSVSLLDIEQFIAITNINNLAPINIDTGYREVNDLEPICDNINKVINSYNSKLYLIRGFSPDMKIVEYLDKNYMTWKKEEGLDLNLYIPSNCRNNKEKLIEF